jgi:hypothetical protein
MHICGMASRDHWVENHRCPKGRRCRAFADGGWDSVPEGFRVVESEHGITFYCSSCDVPVDP